MSLLDLFGTGISSITSIFNGERNRSSQADENQKQRDWQSTENAVNRDWQSVESQKARDWEEQMYNLYNSPSAMKRQYQEAGLNPWLAGQDAVGSPMSSSAPMSGAPASGSPSVAALPSMPDIGRNLMEFLGINAQIGNQQAETDRVKWQTAAEVYDKFGKDAFERFADSNGLFGNPESSQYSQMVAAKIFESNVGTMREQLEASFLQEWRPQEAQAHIDQINKAIDLMTEQINKYKSDEELNYANAYKVGSEVAKNFAEAGYFKAMSGQISQLLPFLVSQYSMATGMQGMSYLSALANFSSEEDIRKWLETGFAKKSKLVTFTSSPENNAILGFVKGVSDSMGNLPKPGSVGSRSFGNDKGSENTVATGWYAPWMNR